MSVDYRSIGGRIKQRRRAAGMTQEQLAERLFVTVGYVSQLERGISKTNLDMLSKICTILDCDMAYLVTGASMGRQDYLAMELANKYARLDQKHRRMLLDIIDVILEHQLISPGEWPGALFSIKKA